MNFKKHLDGKNSIGNNMKQANNTEKYILLRCIIHQIENVLFIPNINNSLSVQIITDCTK